MYKILLIAQSREEHKDLLERLEEEELKEEGLKKKKYKVELLTGKTKLREITDSLESIGSLNGYNLIIYDNYTQQAEVLQKLILPYLPILKAQVGNVIILTENILRGQNLDFDIEKIIESSCKILKKPYNIEEVVKTINGLYTASHNPAP